MIILVGIICLIAGAFIGVTVMCICAVGRMDENQEVKRPARRRSKTAR